jgi:membrane protein YqaA with SNARE-associated domain
MIRRLYNWTLGLAARPSAERWLAGVSFIESSFFPIPPDVVLGPMCLAQRHKALRYAAICTLFSVLGGLFGYAIGYLAFETIGKPILEFYGKSGDFASFSAQFNEGGWLWVMIAGFTPFPFKVITIASGLTHLPLVEFVLAAIVSRGARFFLVGGLFWKYGDPIKDFIDRRLGLVTTLFMLLFIGGFAAIRYL